MGVEEFSGRGIGGKLQVGESEWVQSLGDGGRKARSLLGGTVRENTFCVEVIMAMDPVCGMEVDERKPEFQTQFAGRKYFFCSEDCRKEFENQPEEYVETAA